MTDFDEVFTDNDKVTAAIELANKRATILGEVENAFVNNDGDMRDLIDVVAYFISSQNKYDYNKTSEVIYEIAKTVRFFNNNHKEIGD